MSRKIVVIGVVVVLSGALPAGAHPDKKLGHSISTEYVNKLVAIGCRHDSDSVMIPCSQVQIQARCQAFVSGLVEKCRPTPSLDAAKAAVQRCIQQASSSSLDQRLSAMNEASSKASAAATSCGNQMQIQNDANALRKGFLLKYEDTAQRLKKLSRKNYDLGTELQKCTRGSRPAAISDDIMPCYNRFINNYRKETERENREFWYGSAARCLDGTVNEVEAENSKLEAEIGRRCARSP